MPNPDAAMPGPRRPNPTALASSGKNTLLLCVIQHPRRQIFVSSPPPKSFGGHFDERTKMSSKTTPGDDRVIHWCRRPSINSQDEPAKRWLTRRIRIFITKHKSMAFAATCGWLTSGRHVDASVKRSSWRAGTRNPKTSGSWEHARKAMMRWTLMGINRNETTRQPS
ncbi:hypothetical protein VTN31DRAFT_6482 [Thermomyces dupontii]|uniref:uncharacterized protein n=1 Tax=Talaromyces thermophilus TaxID=28565 RepID=UPI0037424B9B